MTNHVTGQGVNSSIFTPHSKSQTYSEKHCFLREGFCSKHGLRESQHLVRTLLSVSTHWRTPQTPAWTNQLKYLLLKLKGGKTMKILRASKGYSQRSQQGSAAAACHASWRRWRGFGETQQQERRHEPALLAGSTPSRWLVPVWSGPGTLGSWLSHRNTSGLHHCKEGTMSRPVSLMAEELTQISETGSQR